MKTALQAIDNLTKTPEYTPEAIKALMKRLKLGEKAFAVIMNVTPMTVRLWTSGAVKPCNLSRRLIQIYAACPEIADKLANGTGGDKQ